LGLVSWVCGQSVPAMVMIGVLQIIISVVPILITLLEEKKYPQTPNVSVLATVSLGVSLESSLSHHAHHSFHLCKQLLIIIIIVIIHVLDHLLLLLLGNLGGGGV
jgi:hypothetical protein